MPYTHRKVGDKQCVYKKYTGSKVGCTKGDVNKYLAALHANANESVTESNTLKGGSDTKYPYPIYKGDVSTLKTDGEGVSFFTRDKEAADYYTSSRQQQGISPKTNSTFKGYLHTKNPLIVDALKPSPIELKDENGNVLGIFGQGDYIQAVKDAGYDAIIINKKFGTHLDGWEIISFDRKQIIPKTMDSITEINKLKGGKSDKMSVENIAKKFKVSVGKIQAQIQKGVKIEMEHTSDKEKATEIAMDHVSEFPDYYDRLIKMEKKADKKWALDENKSLIKRLLNENLNKRESLNNLLLNFGMLTTLGFSQITKMGKDEEATKELTLMMQNIRKPIINGMPYVKLIENINVLVNNPKLLSAVVNKVREFLIYIKPRIIKYVQDSDVKTNWLGKIENLEKLYLEVIK
jgi:hypothetical protein